MGEEDNIQSNTRIFVDFANNIIASDTKTFYFLSYLKIRAYADNHGGRFFFDTFQYILNTSEKTAQKHINKLIEYKWIEKKGTLYFLTSHKKLTGDKEKYSYITVNKNILNQYSWKNIASFRALLVTIIEAKAKKIQSAIAKGFSVMNYKDKCKEKIKDTKLKRWNALSACSFAASLCNKSKGTISKYRKRQLLATYSHTSNRCIELDYLKSDIYDLDNEYKGILGRYYLYRGLVYFNSISEVVYSFRFYNRI